MTLQEAVLAALGLLLAGLVKGATGLGYSTTALPFLTLATGLHTAMPLVILPSLASNALVMRDAGDLRGALARFWPLYAAVPVGLAAGLALLVHIEAPMAGAALGAVLVAHALQASARPGHRLGPATGRRLQAPVGFLTGLVNGLTGSQIMPLVPYMLALDLEPQQLVQAVNISFTLSSVLMLAGLSATGLSTPPILLASLLGIGPALLGVAAGNRFRRRLPPQVFRRLVLVTLAGLGLLLLARPFW